MSLYIGFIVICIAIYLCMTWLLPKIITYFLIRKFKIFIQFGRISLPSLCLRNVKILKNGFAVEVDEISVRSSFFSSDVTKLLSINISDIRINKDLLTQSSLSGCGSGSCNTHPYEDQSNQTARSSGLDFRIEKIPPSIITFAQFMAIHVHNISVVLMVNHFEPSCFLHATVQELHLDGSILQNTKSLVVTASLNDAQAKLLRHYIITTTASKKINKKTDQLPTMPETATTSLRKIKNKHTSMTSKPCLIELSFGFSLDSVLLAKGSPTLEKIQLIMDNTRAIVHGGLYDFIRDVKLLNHRNDGLCDKKHIKTNPVFTGKQQQQKLTTPISLDDFYERISPIIPKTFLVKIENVRISAVTENSADDFWAKLKLFVVNGKFNTKTIQRECNLPTLYTGLQLQHLEIDTKYEKILFIEQFTVDSTLENDILNTYFKLKTFQLIYNHTEIFEWYHSNFFTNDNNSPSIVVKPLSLLKTNTESYSSTTDHIIDTQGNQIIFEWLVKHMMLKGCAELWNISLFVKLPFSQTSAIRVSHIKFLLEQYTDRRSSTYRNRWINLLVDQRHWSTEFLIESLWWSLGSCISGSVNRNYGCHFSTRDTNNLKKTHTRGSPLFLLVALIKFSSYGIATKLDVSVHTLRAEYSTLLAEFLLQLQQCFYQYGLGKRGFKNTISETFTQKYVDNSTTNGDNLTGQQSTNKESLIIVNTKITDVTTYLFNKYDTCILLNISESTIVRNRQMNILKLNDIQAAILCPQSISISDSSMIGLADFTDIFANIKTIRLEYFQQHPQKHNKQPLEKVESIWQLNLYILQDMEAMWNANLHMHIVTLIREYYEFYGKFYLPISSELNTMVPKTSSEPKRLTIEIFSEGNTMFGIKMSDRHSMQIFLQNFYFSRKDRKNVASITCVFVNIDENHIFTIKDIEVESMTSVEVLTAERRNYENFRRAMNYVWVTMIGEVKCIFPYDHDFADAVQNELNSLIKWLKMVHTVRKKVYTADSTLPSDMIIQVKEFLFELSDDPFEVKLRDNYVLLVDEYHESVKRKQRFDEKIREKYSERLLLPDGMLEELYGNLVRINSEIYVQRSKKINEAGPPRTRLFAWLLTDVQIMAMADPSIHGKDNVIAIMREIDAESPWPEEGIEFITLWCRAVNVSCAEWKFKLRDFPQPMFTVKQMRLFGSLCGAEPMAPRRAKRGVAIEIGSPFDTDMIQRSLTSLKFYHDFDCELDLCSYAFGPCWEPVMAQFNLSFEKISTPSRDPSPALPFWDKLRLLFHGRLTIIAKQFTVLLHASLDPYNTTEEMELSWYNCGIVWTNSKVMFRGELNVCVRTASRYDDCRLLHFPNLKLTFKLNWICLANPNDHHAVIPCAPDKLPEYSSNQVHDSFRAFRSQNVNIWVSFETKPVATNSANAGSEIDIPNLVLYGSTLRWFENLKLILSGITRPTRRGPVFNNIRPRKKQLSRHYRKAHLQMSLHKFQVLYWMSHALHRGFELNGGRVTFSSEHTLTVHPIDDGLIHRPRADWGTMYMNCELNDAEIWLKSILSPGASERLSNDLSSSQTSADNLSTDSMKIVKFYFLSLDKVSYGRETIIQTSNNETTKHKDTPTHKLVIYDLKGAWTKNNRDIAFVLFDSFMKAQKLKNNLSIEALKGFRKDGTTSGTTPLKSARRTHAHQVVLTSSSTGTPVTPSTSSSSSGGTSTTQLFVSSTTSKSTSSSLHSKQQQSAGGSSNSSGNNTGGGSAGASSGGSSSSSISNANHASKMLQQLIAEADHKFNVYSDDLSTQTREQQLQGLQACQDEDVTQYNWFISLVNSQVLLKGCETSGYVILSAAKAEILQRVHRPVWRDRSLVSKTTWVGFLECMQYYATVSAGDSDDSLLDENIMWLTLDNIEEKDKDASTSINELPDIPHLVGSGQSVGGVVSETVGGAPGTAGIGETYPVQLQRIVSRCKCEFFYVSYGDTSIDPSSLTEVPPPPPEETLSPWSRQDDPVDAFTLMHHDLDVCTNSLQYAMILDIVNNLMLYVEPQRKQALEKLARMRFQLQLYSMEDQKRPIQHLQTQVRGLMSKLRFLEKDIHLIGKAQPESSSNGGSCEQNDAVDDEMRQDFVYVQHQINECKDQLTIQSEELDMMLSCYKETQLSAMNKLATVCKDKPVVVDRTNEICFKHAQWRLTEADGLIGISDLILSNFLYTKKSRSDDSVEHLLELGYIRMNNLIPREIYKEVMCPTEIQKDMPVDHQRVLRVFCREKPPVGGISVKEHFEINVVPITIAITKKFYSTMLKFCFPDRDPTTDADAGDCDLDVDGSGGVSIAGSSSASLRSTTTSSKQASAKGIGKVKRNPATSKDSAFYVRIEKDDVEKMKERAEKNKLFIYIKIPEVPVRVSYKGNKEKNLEDITDFSLVIPTLEYHNVTWTWLDLLLAMKSDSRRVILSQAIKQKLQIHRNKPLSSVTNASSSTIGERASSQEEDKAKMLFGNQAATENKNQRRGLFKFTSSLSANKQH